ncbi:MAG: PASTA domain-containing protein [Coriobacteriales bacterium]|nr:PASTA domain-containing protein [Coriobacteriales bacterium]
MNTQGRTSPLRRSKCLFALLATCMVAFCLVFASFAYATEGAFTFTGGSVSDTSSTPTSIKLNKEAFSFESGEARLLTATSADSTDAAPLGYSDVIWTSSDPKVATVLSSGVVTANSRGTATITCTLAKDKNVSASCKVTVTANITPVTDILAFQSTHPYDADSRDLWTYYNPFAASIILTFDSKTNVEEGFDFIEVTDDEGKIYGRFTGTQLASDQVEVLGDSAWVRLVADSSNTEWGFAVISVEPVIYDGWYEYAGKTYLFLGGEMQKGMVEDGDLIHHFDETTGEYLETTSVAPTPSYPVLPDAGGPAVYKVPYLYFMDYDDAMAILNAMGLNVIENWIYDDAFYMPYGTIIYQSRPDGADIAAGEDFLINISLGPGNVTVPNLLGKTPADANAILTEDHLVPIIGGGAPTTDTSLLNTVAWQEPMAYTEVPYGSNVILHFYTNE